MLFNWGGDGGMNRRRALLAMGLAGALAALGTAGCSSESDSNSQGIPQHLRVGIIPNISPEKQQAQYEPFRKYLADRLHVDVELFVATDYAGVVAALVSEKVDVAYLGGLTYVQADEQTDVTPMVTEVDEETGTPKYLSAVAVKKDSPHQSVKDVVDAGGRFAFGDVSSTSGSLYPRVMLVGAGARCQPDDLASCPPLSRVVFTGGHDAAAQAVLNGSADAAGLELRILHRLERQGTVPTGALRVVQTHEVMGYPWVARADLSAQARTTLTEAFTSITDPSLLSLMRAKRYVPVTEADYASLRDEATKLGLLTAKGR
ncbi:phosphate/phosphite/phosphonate ABC transporter substrate-binding protein [Micromonospora sp. NPDC050495]|uniref:phosphate/phosphite/phosphonate ABC transporter substrate-binding protein n=1 Tax=Micromonospora sp. NPDC050495 TaxID=3154936 RepID=UPI0033D4A37C